MPRNEYELPQVVRSQNVAVHPPSHLRIAKGPTTLPPLSLLTASLSLLAVLPFALWWNSAAKPGCCQTPSQKAVSQDQPAPATPSVGGSTSKLDQVRFRTELVRGKIVWTNEVLSAQFGVSTVRDAAKRSLAIQTIDGSLLPLVEDVRGHAFRTDERLREMNVELFVRRYEQHPLLQILKIFEIKDGKRYEVDYWCDICAIVMFEKGPCACCQDDNRLRKRLVE